MNIMNTKTKDAHEIDLGRQSQKQGRFDDAEEHFSKALKENPKNAEAKYLLGVLKHRKGEKIEGYKLIEDALSTSRNADVYFHLGQLLIQDRQWMMGMQSLQNAIDINPELYDAYLTLGFVGTHIRKPQISVKACSQVIERLTKVGDKEKLAKAYYLLALALRLNGQYLAAIQSFQRSLQNLPGAILVIFEMAKTAYHIKDFQQALGLVDEVIKKNPKEAEGYHLRGLMYRDLNKNDEAVESFKKAIEMNPRQAETYFQISRLLNIMRKYEEALTYGLKSLELSAKNYLYYYNVSSVYLSLNDYDNSILHARKSVELSPNFASGYNIIGFAQSFKSMFKEGLKNVEKAIDLDPTVPAFHLNRGIMLLRQGDYVEGWREYEWRLRDTILPIRNDFRVRTWSNEPLNGKVLYIFAEQGLGDNVFCSRYLPLIKKQYPDARIYCEVDVSLRRLFEENYGDVAKFLVRGDEMPRYDYLCSMLSLPFVFKTTLETIPCNGQYLKPNAECMKKWSDILGGNKKKKIGLVWGGNPNHKNNINRTTHPKVFLPLLGLGGCKFYSLQYSEQKKELNELPKGLVEDVASHIYDFMDTAAALTHLDALISVDTSIVHIAGALGRPVYLMLPENVSWHWLMNRQDSPWYESVQLFRQKQLGDWTPVIEGIRDVIQKSQRK
jgi:tetratricopeptide (TPR) repeat protein